MASYANKDWIVILDCLEITSALCHSPSYHSYIVNEEYVEDICITEFHVSNSLDHISISNEIRLIQCNNVIQNLRV